MRGQALHLHFTRFRVSVCARPVPFVLMKGSVDLDRTHPPYGLSDRFALGLTKFLRFLADTFFAKHCGHRAVVLEIITAVPGMVGATLQHLKALRYMSDDHGWIRALMDEAENERMHLLTFIEIARPTRFERWLIILAQGIFYNFLFLLCLISPRTAPRVVGYFEEGAMISYTEFLAEVEAGHRDINHGFADQLGER